jgi:hypothetical protein
MAVAEIVGVAAAVRAAVRPTGAPRANYTPPSHQLPARTGGPTATRSGAPRVESRVTRRIVNSAGEERTRVLVSSEDALLAEAERWAGGSLDNFSEYKPNWWQSPDGRVRIEFNLEGHANVNEGPHVTVRVFNGQRHAVVEKIFIEGRETYE